MDAREFNKVTNLPVYLFLKWDRLGMRKNLIETAKRVSFKDAQRIDFDIMPDARRKFVEQLGIPIRTQDEWIKKDRDDYRYRLIIFLKWAIVKGIVDDLIEV